MTVRRIVVVGGGIAGLTAAYTLAEARRAGAPLEESLVEASGRLGGSLRSERVEGCLVEAGADSFLTEKRDAIELCEQLGLGDQLVGSLDEQRRTLILHRGRLTPLPEGFEFLVPTRPWAVARTPLLSLSDKLALAREWLAPPRPAAGDESVAGFIERHFSRGLLENVVDPLLTAVYGGDARSLSAASVLPRFVELARKDSSLVRGLRRAAGQRKAHTPGAARPPIFTTLRDGLETLVEALRARLDAKRVFLQRRVVALTGIAGSGGYGLNFEGGEVLEAEAVILALPAYESSRLLRPLDAALAGPLDGIRYSSSMIIALGYEGSRLAPLPQGFGFLVPRREGKRLLACTFVGQKFPHRAAAGRVLLRCFLGGMRDEAALELSDAEATGIAQRELREILGISAEPRFARVYRWPKALAQYTVGHGARLEAVSTRLATHRRLLLCGNAYLGIGVPDCVRSGKRAAEECLRRLQEN